MLGALRSRCRLERKAAPDSVFAAATNAIGDLLLRPRPVSRDPGSPRHPKPAVGEAVAGDVEVASRRAQAPRIVVEGTTAAHAGRLAANPGVLRTVMLVQTPLPNVATHVHSSNRRGSVRVHTDCDCVTESAFLAVRLGGIPIPSPWILVLRLPTRGRLLPFPFRR